MRSSKFPRTTNQDTLIHWPITSLHIRHPPTSVCLHRPPPAPCWYLRFPGAHLDNSKPQSVLCIIYTNHSSTGCSFSLSHHHHEEDLQSGNVLQKYTKKYTATRQPPDRLTSSLVRKNVLFILVIYRLPTASHPQVRLGGCLLSFPSNQSESSNRFRVNRSEAQLNQLDAINEGDVFRKCPSVNCFPFPGAFLFLTRCRA